MVKIGFNSDVELIVLGVMNWFYEFVWLGLKYFDC